jgi:hypothetical protein
VPLPFSRVALVVAAPQYVARGADDAGLEAARLRLQETLLSLRVRALALLDAR